MVKFVKATTPRICVFSTFYGIPAFTADSIRNHLSYCNLHGYSYKPYLFDKPTARQFSWAKVLLAIQLLESGQWDALFWMDADSWFLNQAICLHDWLTELEPIQFTGDDNDIFNGGHFLLRYSPASIQWLKACWQICETTDSRFVTTHKDEWHLYDQPGILAILGGAQPEQPSSWADAFNAVNGYPGNSLRVHKNFQDVYAPTTASRCAAARSLICDKWRPHCLIRPQSAMNSYPWTVKDGDFIVHFVGNTKHLMQEWRDRFRFYPDT